MKNRDLYVLRKLQHDTKMRLKNFSSFIFVSFFDNEEILAKVRKIFEYNIPIYCKKPHNLSDSVYQKWLYDVFNSLSLSNHLVVLLDGAKLWCNIEVISYDNFSREMVELNPNRDFTIIDIEKYTAIDFSSGEIGYEIRVLNYMM